MDQTSYASTHAVDSRDADPPGHTALPLALSIIALIVVGAGAVVYLVAVIGGVAV